MSKVNDLMAEDVASSQSRTPTNEELQQLSTLVQSLQEQEQEVDRITEDLKKAKEKLQEVSMERIPNLFDQLGLSQIKLASGETVEVRRTFAAHISQKNWPAAVKWLRDNGHEAIVKHDVIVKLKKGEEEQHRSLIAQLNDDGFSYADKESVHPQTLKAFVTEQIESGADIPMDTFGVHPVRTTKVS